MVRRKTKARIVQKPSVGLISEICGESISNDVFMSEKETKRKSTKAKIKKKEKQKREIEQKGKTAIKKMNEKKIIL